MKNFFIGCLSCLPLLSLMIVLCWGVVVANKNHEKIDAWFAIDESKHWTTLQYNGHDYLMFKSELVHDPDCKKCKDGEI